jgi:hypothetical protein
MLKLLPKRIKAGLLKRFREYERVKKLEVAGSIPVVDLGEKHIANAKLLTNRERLLEQLPKGGVVAEIGVNQGDYSSKILDLTSPRKLHLIDEWGTESYHDGLASAVKKKFANEIVSGQVEINRGYSTEVLPRFADSSFDWVYIDSAHTYEVTRDELAILNTKVKDNGFICGHDYINSCWRNAVKYGVVEAVHEFCVREGWELVYLTNETHQHCSFCIRRLK